ncbi:methylmalonate-semialdehyde dehydrogenase [acylating] [bacterium BMS3Abin07]|nr:methylmalonate-semialdehyde dehydrogenase [acylating] [bacterium BMS3Abin07]GBE32491.1 methylmalonate-semialdehyde dehydrogenase [acylating] [bacterium BMS3Bbin05]HDO21503.1 aldehyde dehydrogenase family protein [Nitrospirota bacterium]HDZ88738.1 aldehyde dehydrogenase family protein [Nitrospirota bacterium]
MKIGLLRSGENYYTIEQSPVYSYKGEKVAVISKTDAGILRWDLKQNRSFINHYRSMKLSEIESIFKTAGRLFAEEKLKMGSENLGPAEYAAICSLSTGAPISNYLKTLERVKDIFNRISDILAFQALDGDVHAYEKGYVRRNGKRIGWIPRGKNLCIVTPSNHPVVNIIWTIACAMGYPIVLRPSQDDPFTPLRLISALMEAGMPASSFSFYPGGHMTAREMLALCDLFMIFGGFNITKDYGNQSSVKVFGTGSSKIVVGEDYVDKIEAIVDVAVSSMMKDGGRGCINLSAIITTGNARAIAEGIASKIASIGIRDPIEKGAIIGAFKNKNIALSINAQIESGISDNSDIDVTASLRNFPRIIDAFGATFIFPTVILCKDYNSPLFGKEFPFPFITVTEVDRDGILDAASDSLVVTLLSDDDELFKKLLFCPDIGKVYHGVFPTTDIDFQDPHEGFISDFLFKTKALKGGI